ncbi:MAG: hypothetical protein D6705_02075 [Deltaproteobacteria bacterium]|nr:MAG: hypothetical protein D6705_02075 [Deltaproteobacteria bacterium]
MWAITSVGRCTRAMTLARVNVLPLPVIPSRVWYRSPRVRPSTRASMAAGCPPRGTMSVTSSNGRTSGGRGRGAVVDRGRVPASAFERCMVGYDSTCVPDAPSPLYPIVDLPHPSGRSVLDVTAAICRAAEGRLFAIQVRMKEGSTAARVEAARQASAAASAWSVPVWMNDDGAAALEAGPAVAGLHVGQDDPDLGRLDELRAAAAERGRPLAVGISTHDETQLRRAWARSPDLVAFGPVRPTASKARPDPVVGWSRLVEACRASPVPVVAIGGLRPADAPRLAAAGVGAVATISAVSGPDLATVEARTRAFVAALDEAFAPRSVESVAAEIPVLDPEVLAALPAISGDVGSLRAMGLPARFAPYASGKDVWYRPSDVADLLDALDKAPEESWEAWRARHPGEAPVLRIRRP